TETGKTKLREAMLPHVQYFFQLLKDGYSSSKKCEDVSQCGEHQACTASQCVPLLTAPQRDEELVAEVRTKLQSIPVFDRYYAQFILSLTEEKWDDEGDNSLE